VLAKTRATRAIGPDEAQAAVLQCVAKDKDATNSRRPQDPYTKRLRAITFDEPIISATRPKAEVGLVDVFRARAEARALLVQLGELGLHDAVDVLQSDAERDGLVDALGQDALQQILATAFAGAS
jgi:hypothetical protein